MVAALLAEAAGAVHADGARMVLGAVLIFFCRITDMSIDTLRVLALVRGHRLRAAAYGFLEAGIFIVALTTVFRPPIHWVQMLGYAAGFAVGTLTGMTVAKWVSSEFVLLRVLSRPHGPDICAQLRKHGIAVTSVAGEGRDGPLVVLFSVVRRELGEEALQIVRRVDPTAFVVLEPVRHASGGHLPRFIGPGVAVRR